MYFWCKNKKIVAFEFFISKRIVNFKTQDIKISAPIIRISIISIALSIVVNLITISIVNGFQNEIREKIIGFNAPLFISKIGSNSLYESNPIYKNDELLKKINDVEGVSSITPISYKQALLQSAKFIDTLKLASGKDSLINRQEISGVIIKGVSKDYNWNFINQHLISGRITKADKNNNEILVSEKICKNLNFKLLDEITCFYVKNKPVARRYKIVGIFNTGFEEYDKKIIFCNIEEVQKMNDYSISSSIEINDTLQNSKELLITANVGGLKEGLLFDWGKGPDIYSGFYLSEIKNTTIRLVVYEVNKKSNKINPID